MPATAARLGFITEELRLVTAGPDAGVVAKYGELARDTKEPLETFFDDEDDAQIIADERLALLSPDRRLVEFSIDGVETGHALDFSGMTPSAARDVPRYGMSDSAAIVDMEIDYQNSVTIVKTWG